MRKWGPETGLVWGDPTKKFKILKDKGVKYFNLFKKDFCFQASCTEAVPRAALLLPTNIYWNPTTSHSKKDGVSGKMRIPRVWFQHWIEACDVTRKSLQYEKPCLLNTSTRRPPSPFLSLHQGRHQSRHLLFVRRYPLIQASSPPLRKAPRANIALLKAGPDGHAVLTLIIFSVAFDTLTNFLFLQTPSPWNSSNFLQSPFLPLTPLELLLSIFCYN